MNRRTSRVKHSRVKCQVEILARDVRSVKWRFSHFVFEKWADSSVCQNQYEDVDKSIARSHCRFKVSRGNEPPFRSVSRGELFRFLRSVEGVAQLHIFFDFWFRTWERCSRPS